MNNIAIRTSELSKRYRIGQVLKMDERLGEKVTEMLAAPFRRGLRILRGDSSGAANLQKELWALKDINIEISRGEVVGIIGRNGAGKSTLLKILSRITEPTEGWAEIYGRVGSLLEVGTGFHPELTGRENIYLNGALLGMKGAEIRAKFDRIVSFAEVGQFIDTPVKHYSSGMYVRLAFSVAAHLEPEILLVDEVLAVGDAAFQNRCLGKMGDVAKEGRTVVFVSHNMGVIQALCQRCILLRDGGVSSDGPTRDVIDEYLRTFENVGSVPLSERTDRRGLGETRLTFFSIDGGHEGRRDLKSGGFARFAIQAERILPGLSCTILIYDSLGQPLLNFQSKLRAECDSRANGAIPRFVCEVDQLYLRPGRYRVDLALSGDNRLQDFIEGAAAFEVAEGSIGGRPVSHHRKFQVSIPHRWVSPEGC